MITDGLLWLVGRFLMVFVVWADGLFPSDWDMTAFAGSTSGGLDWILSGAGMFSNWIPVQMIITFAGLLISARIIGFMVHMGRLALSLISGGGGAT